MLKADTKVSPDIEAVEPTEGVHVLAACGGLAILIIITILLWKVSSMFFMHMGYFHERGQLCQR